MRLFDPLYARDSKGKILSWIASVTMDNNHAVITVHEGLLDGRQTPNLTIVKKGKNIGKMNETTPFDQAISQAESKWNKKRKQGYKSLKDLGISLLTDLDMKLPLNRTDENGLSKPMKAQPYFKDNGDVRIKFPCYGQPKLNGFRVFGRLEKLMEGEGMFASEVIKPTFRSKEGLRYTILEHIEPHVETLINTLSSEIGIAPKDIVLDGEMYIHGEILSEISSAVRTRKEKTKALRFCIFDIAVEGVLQDKRIDFLNIVHRIVTKENLNSINNVETIIVTDNAHAQTLTDQYIKEGYEGAIFRDRKAPYQFGKRPQTMVKLKRSQDKEFKIVDVVGGDATPELGVFVCLAENGKTFKCTPEGTVELKTEYLTNKAKYIGKKVTVRFFERTKEDLPFHAVATTIRDYE